VRERGVCVWGGGGVHTAAGTRDTAWRALNHGHPRAHTDAKFAKSAATPGSAPTATTNACAVAMHGKTRQLRIQKQGTSNDAHTTHTTPTRARPENRVSIPQLQCYKHEWCPARACTAAFPFPSPLPPFFPRSRKGTPLTPHRGPASATALHSAPCVSLNITTSMLLSRERPQGGASCQATAASSATTTAPSRAILGRLTLCDHCHDACPRRRAGGALQLRFCLRASLVWTPWRPMCRCMQPRTGRAVLGSQPS
jgi:hypothetical protein